MIFSRRLWTFSRTKKPVVSSTNFVAETAYFLPWPHPHPMDSPFHRQWTRLSTSSGKSYPYTIDLLIFTFCEIVYHFSIEIIK